MDFCRVCLSTATKKDFREVESKINKNETHKSYTEVVSFCLDIQVNEKSKCRLLCPKCFESILHFYKFKTLALKNDAYFKAVESKICVQLDDTPLVTKQSVIESVNKSKNETNTEPLSLNNVAPYDNQVEIKKENEVKSNDGISSSVSAEYLLESDKSIEEYKKPLRQNKIDSTDEEWSSSDNEWVEQEILRSHSQELKTEDRKKQTNQNKDGSSICLLCNEIFVVRSDLLRHMRNVHGYLCHFCSVRCRSKKAFVIHLRTHINEKPFECEECGRGFIEECRLRWHMSVHSGERNYPCKECGKAFKRPNNLQTHSLTHTKLKQFQCNYCGKQFSLNFNLKTHIRNVHEKLIYKEKH